MTRKPVSRAAGFIRRAAPATGPGAAIGGRHFFRNYFTDNLHPAISDPLLDDQALSGRPTESGRIRLAWAKRKG